MAFFLEFWQFMRARKKYWLVPVVILLLVIGAIVVAAQGSVVAPFIYAIF